MNIYSKFCPNVFVAKCDKLQVKGDTIIVTTQYGKEHECVVFNHVLQKDGFHYYSIVRADGFNVQEYAKNKAERYQKWANSREEKSTRCWEASSEGKDFLVLAEPIKIGHHSEKKHRALIERNHNRMSKSVEHSKFAEAHESKSDYWNSRALIINLSMPESVEYYEFKAEEAKEKHQGLKDGTIERSHSFSLTYAKKDLNEAEKKLQLAKILWA